LQDIIYEKNLENVIYEKDYSAMIELDKEPSAIQTEIQKLADEGLFRAYQLALEHQPKRIIAQDKENYERILKECDTYAKNWYGQVRGIVNYQDWEARIYVTTSQFMEFSSDEEFSLLQDIFQSCDHVTFQTVEDGKTQMCIFFSYFEDVLPDENDREAVYQMYAAGASAMGLSDAEFKKRWDLLEKENWPDSPLSSKQEKDAE